MNITFDIEKTRSRYEQLQRYMHEHVLNDGHFLCKYYKECQKSHPGKFLEGQLHHIGKHYDIQLDSKPLRIVIVGQEYGHEPRQVTLDARREMIMLSGKEKRFLADGIHPPRNPHMRGTTSALRLLFGLSLGNKHDEEYLQFKDDSRCHIFEAFSLVNYLLCSAVNGNTRGMSTSIMHKNCDHHFSHVLGILEPTIIIIQGKGFWDRSIKRLFELHSVTGAKELPLYKVKGIGIGTNCFLAAFTHPSAHGKHNWGVNEKTPYLLNVVKPTIEEFLRQR